MHLTFKLQASYSDAVEGARWRTALPLCFEHIRYRCQTDLPNDHCPFCLRAMPHPRLAVVRTLSLPLLAFFCFCLLLGAYLLLRRTRGVLLRGPPSPSWLFGVTRTLAGPPAAGLLYERWAEEYGSVYSIPCELGQSCVVLCDPKAIQHFYACETREYVHTTLLRTFVERIVSGVSSRSHFHRIDTAVTAWPLSLLGRR